MDERASGILCHISSLPSPYAIGDLGPEAYRFVDLLAQAGQKFWQVLPLNPTDSALGNSPYSSFSAFAFNVLFISPETLCDDGLVSKEDLLKWRDPLSGDVDYERAAFLKREILSVAWRNYTMRRFGWKAFERFCAEEDWWLQDFVRFVVLKERFSGALWSEWPEGFRDRHPGVMSELDRSEEKKMMEVKFQQFLFFRQWQGLQKYCSCKGIGIIGDIPIYVNYDSVDVWVNPEVFKLDGNKKPVTVAGVPPDYFSKDGQRWGNPVYNWDRLKETGFHWWAQRVRHNLALFDLVRIDHFRAFAQCWEIPAEEKTAVRGEWRDVPGHDLFFALQERFPRLPIIAEDLGIITPDVDALKEKFGFPGMCVVMFAFHNEYRKSRDLPENYKPLSVVYSGTHDNNTVRGWFDHDVTPVEKKNMQEYFGRDIDPEEAPWVMIELALRSVSVLAIIPLQDVLGMGAEARMNKPSTVIGNWKWRFDRGLITKGVIQRLKRVTMESSR